MRTLKGIQEKVASIINSLRFWNIVEQKQEMLPANEDQMVSRNMETAALFEQTISLVGQAFSLIHIRRYWAFYKWLLTILPKYLDNTENPFLFEEKLK